MIQIFLSDLSLALAAVNYSAIFEIFFLIHFSFCLGSLLPQCLSFPIYLPGIFHFPDLSNWNVPELHPWPLSPSTPKTLEISCGLVVYILYNKNNYCCLVV